MENYQLPILQLPIPSVLAYFLITIAVWSLLGRLYPVLRFVCKYRPQSSLITRCGAGSWAVITGASYGIGLGFARVLAARGFNLVLIARSEDTLRKIAEGLEHQTGIQTRVIAFDFSRGTDFEDLCRQMSDLDVSMLVNNVGWGKDELFRTQAVEAIVKTLQLNIWPAVALSRWALSRMENRTAESVVINLSSAATLLPLPTAAVYSATKVFLDFFSRALANEKSLHHVHVLSLRPAFVLTPMVEANQHADEAMIISEQQCAEAALEHVFTAPYTMGHWKHRLVRGAAMLLPEWVAAKIALRRFKSPN